MNKSWLCVWLTAGFAVGSNTGAGAEAPVSGSVVADGPWSEWDPALSLPGARVLLPYPELRELLHKAWREDARKKEVPPVEAALVSAHFALRVGADSPGLEARFEAAVFAEGWRLVPLVACDMASAAIEPQSADVVTRDGVLSALVHGPGRASITLRFELPEARKNPGSPFLKITTQPAAASKLTVAGLGKAERLRVVGLPYAIDGGQETPLSSAGATLEISLEEDRPPVPPRWAANAVVLVEHDETFLRYEARIVADAVEGSASEMVLELPADSREVGVESARVSRWEVSPGEGQRDLLKIAWADTGARSREVRLKWRTPPRGETDRWPLECARPQGARSFDAMFVAARPEATALDVDPPAAAMPAVTLPAWVREKLASRDHVAVTAGAALVPRRLRVAEAERATVKSFKCATTLVRDGSALAEGAFEIEHAEALRWKVRLPEGGRLLKCATNGATAQPVLGEDGGLEFLLPSNPKGISEVYVSYTGKGAAMDPVGGHMSLQLPSTPLFTDRIEWYLTLPQAYEVTAVDGNLEVGNGKGEVLMLEKRLCRGETPTVDLHYRKKAPRE